MGQASSTGFWKDSATGLIWTAKDNGSDVNWNRPVIIAAACGWAGIRTLRLPTVDELEAIYDSSLSPLNAISLGLTSENNRF